MRDTVDNSSAFESLLSVGLVRYFNAPNFEKVGSILVSAFVCVCVGGGGALRFRLETLCMDSSWKNSRHVFFPNYLTMSNYGPSKKTRDLFFKCSISKSIKARNLKLVSADIYGDDNRIYIWLHYFPSLR